MTGHNSRFALLLRAVGAAVLLSSASATPASAQTTVAARYADTLAKEQAVRTALAAEQAEAAVIKALRTVVREYDGLVRRYPTSSYSDDALWHAAQLSLEALRKFGEEQDQAAAVRFLKALASEYPASKFAKEVPAALATLDARLDVKPDATKSVATTGAAGRLRQGNSEPGRPSKEVTRPAGGLATIKEIHRAVLGETVRVTIELDREVPFHNERLENPPRVFVDLGATRAVPALIDQTFRFDDDADMVRQIRVGRHPGNVTRVVLDAIGSSDCSLFPLYGPYRLVIDCVRAGQPAPPPVLTARRLDVPWARTVPAVASGAAAVLLGAREPESPLPAVAVATPPVAAPAATPLTAVGKAVVTTTDAPDSAPSAPPAAPTPAPARLPARNVGGGFSIARQLGLAVSRIVIDPGHGGHDPGATGRGVHEAELVLDIALRLEKLLAKVQGVEVILTRRTNTYVPLEERTAIANREGADLFLSIHANASNSVRASGVETYFLNFATTLGAEAVAARENAASGHAMGALPDLVKAIALDNKLDESRDLATMVQRAMMERLRASNKSVKDLGVKQAPFVVLIGAAMPSVLAEVAFVTNAQEARLLKGTSYRQRIAEALFNAIQKYQTALKSEGRVAQRP